MKFTRLFQPRNPLFWLMLILNLLSLILLTLAQTRSLNTMATVLVNGFALCNALAGIWLARRLARGEPEKE